MAKQPHSGASASPSLRTFPKPWKGSLLLACSKCQKKLRREDHRSPAGRLRKALKHQARANKAKLRIRVIETSCLKLCPHGAVTVCTADQLAQGSCSIVRTEADIALLYRICAAGERVAPDLPGAPAMPLCFTP